MLYIRYFKGKTNPKWAWIKDSKFNGTYDMEEAKEFTSAQVQKLISYVRTHQSQVNLAERFQIVSIRDIDPNPMPLMIGQNTNIGRVTEPGIVPGC